MLQLSMQEFRKTIADSLNKTPLIISRYDKPIAIVVPFDERLLGLEYDTMRVLLQSHIKEIETLLIKGGGAQI